MHRKFITLLMIVSGLLSACASVNAPGNSGKLGVVATFSLIGDWARNVGGDAIELSTLVGPGRDTHTFEPTAEDAQALARADVILENGAGFEGWLTKLYATANSKARRVVLSDGIPLRTLGGSPDPHVWHDVANAIRMVGHLRDGLIAADPAHAAVYTANADKYIAELQALDAWIVDQVQTLPADRRKLVTTHDTFGYFAQRYGFDVLGTILPTTTEGASPSAQQIAALVEAVKAAGVPAVFAENVSSNALLQQVADEAGVRVVASLYTDALGPPGSDGDTYLKIMRSNVTTIISALRP